MTALLGCLIQPASPDLAAVRRRSLGTALAAPAADIAASASASRTEGHKGSNPSTRARLGRGLPVPVIAVSGHARQKVHAPWADPNPTRAVGVHQPQGAFVDRLVVVDVGIENLPVGGPARGTGIRIKCQLLQ